MLLTNLPKSKSYLNRAEQEPLLHFYEKGEEVPLFEPGCWQVYRGVVQLNRINYEGEEIVLGWVTANGCFGSCLENSPSYRAQALTNVYVRWLAPTEIENSPYLARMLLAQLSQRLIKAEQLLAVSGLRRVEERLWQLILLLKEELGQPVTEGTRLVVRFTHQHLASVICTTRVTITRILGDFQARELITFDSDRHLIVKAK